MALQNASATQLLATASAPETMSIRLPTLTETNFLSWKLVIVDYLKWKQLDHCIAERPTIAISEANEIRAKLVLLSSIDSKLIPQVSSCAKAKEIFDRLLLVHSDASKANAGRLLKKYFSYKRDPADKLSTHIGKLENMREELYNI